MEVNVYHLAHKIFVGENEIKLTAQQWKIFITMDDTLRTGRAISVLAFGRPIDRTIDRAISQINGRFNWPVIECRFQAYRISNKIIVNHFKD